MICPSCQRYIKDSTTSCPICGRILHGISSEGGLTPSPTPRLSIAPEMPSQQLEGYPCPTCRGIVSPSDQFCPQCQSPVVQTNAGRDKTVAPRPSSEAPDRFAPTIPSQVPAPVSPTARQALPEVVEGDIVGDPLPLPNEPRDVDWLQVAVAALLLAEVLIGALMISARLLFIAIILIVVGLFFSPIGFLGAGCLREALNLPFRAIRLIWGPLRTALTPGLDPNNMRQVREYRVNPISGSADTFVVKGNLAPRNLGAGDHVRIRVANRNGRPYFRDGQLHDPYSGNWIPLRISEAPVGTYWLLGFSGLTAFLIYLYLASAQGR